MFSYDLYYRVNNVKTLGIISASCRNKRLPTCIPPTTVFWQQTIDKCDFVRLWYPDRRLQNPGKVEDQIKLFWEVRPVRRCQAYWLWSQLQTQKQPCPPVDLVTAPFGLGPATNTIYPGIKKESHLSMPQEIRPTDLSTSCGPWCSLWPGSGSDSCRPGIVWATQGLVKYMPTFSHEDRQTDLGPATDPEMSLLLSSSPSQTWSWLSCLPSNLVGDMPVCATSLNMTVGPEVAI